MNRDAAALEIRDVSVLYGANRVLDRISLNTASGEFIALLGASGCGKTTLLRAICGFVPVAGGSIAVGGRDITRLPPDKRDIAMVFQSYALWPHMTVAQNIGYGLKLRSVGRAEIAARVAELLALLRLEGLGGRKVTALSGGQRQIDGRKPQRLDSHQLRRPVRAPWADAAAGFVHVSVLRYMKTYGRAHEQLEMVSVVHHIERAPPWPVGSMQWS